MLILNLNLEHLIKQENHFGMERILANEDGPTLEKFWSQQRATPAAGELP